MDLESMIDEQTFSSSATNSTPNSNQPSYKSGGGFGDSDKNKNEIFTWRVKAGANRIYYLNIKTDRKGDFYLVIKETKHRDDGSKEVHRVMVFEKDLGNFVVGMQKVVEEIEKRGGTIDMSGGHDDGMHHESGFNNQDNKASSQGQNTAFEEDESTKDLPTIEL